MVDNIYLLDSLSDVDDFDDDFIVDWTLSFDPLGRDLAELIEQSSKLGLGLFDWISREDEFTEDELRIAHSARKRLSDIESLLSAEQGNVENSYIVLALAQKALTSVLYDSKESLSPSEYDALLYLGRCLKRLNQGMAPDDAFKVKVGRGGGGRPTQSKIFKRNLKNSMTLLCAVYVARLMKRGSTLDEACELVAEKIDEEVKESTVRDWYRKHCKNITAEFIDSEESRDPCFKDIELIPPAKIAMDV